MEAYKPSKAVIKEHEGAEFVPYHQNPKDNKQAFKKVEKQHSKRQKIGSEGNLSAPFVIIKVSPPPPWTCPLHPIPPNLQPLPVIMRGSNDRE